MILDLSVNVIQDLLEHYSEKLFIDMVLDETKAKQSERNIHQICQSLDANGYDSQSVLANVKSKIDLVNYNRPVVAYVDGAVRGTHDRAKTSEAAIAFVIYDGNRAVYEHAQRVGVCRSIEAEYMALIRCLETLLSNGFAKRKVRICSDYQPLVRQLQMRYKASLPSLVALRDRARDLVDRFSFLEVEYIPREGNVYADMLANQALDKGGELVA